MKRSKVSELTTADNKHIFKAKCPLKEEKMQP